MVGEGSLAKADCKMRLVTALCMHYFLVISIGVNKLISERLRCSKFSIVHNDS